MQIVNKTLKCSICGCISLPDATRCPKCGAIYNNNMLNTGSEEIFGSNRYLSIPRPDDTDTKIYWVYYQLTCPLHGKVDVRAIVIASAIKCPFCQLNKC